MTAQFVTVLHSYLPSGRLSEANRFPSSALVLLMQHVTNRDSAVLTRSVGRNAPGQVRCL